MGRSFYLTALMTADLTTPPSLYQRVEFSRDVQIETIRAMVIQYGDPAYTSITMRIHGERASGPGAILATSSAQTKTALFAAVAHGYMEANYDFSTPVIVRAGTGIYVSPNIAGYTGTDSSYIGLAKSWPAPIYKTGLTIETRKADKLPIDMHYLGKYLS